MKVPYVLCSQIPTAAANIRNIDMSSHLIDLVLTNDIADLQEIVISKHGPKYGATSARVFKPKDSRRLNDAILRQTLETKAFDSFADQLLIDSTLAEVFDVSANEQVTHRCTLIVCLDPPRHNVHYVLCSQIPTAATNIKKIDMLNSSIDLVLTNDIANLQESIIRKHGPKYGATVARTYRPKDRSSFDDINLRQTLSSSAFDEYADRLMGDSTLADVFDIPATGEVSPGCTLIVCLDPPRHNVHYVLCSQIPTAATNIKKIDMLNSSIDLVLTNDIADLQEIVISMYGPKYGATVARTYRPKDLSSITDTILRQTLRTSALHDFADELAGRSTIHEVFDIPATGEVSPGCTLIVCLDPPRHNVHCVLCSRIPTADIDIRNIDMSSHLIDLVLTNNIADLREIVISMYGPKYGATSAKVFKPKDSGRLSDTILRRNLETKAFDSFTDQLLIDSTIAEVFGVSVNDLVPRRCTLIVCLDPPPPAQFPAALADNAEASDIVGKLKTEFTKYSKNVLAGSTPSAAAKSSNYSSIQASNTALLDGRFNKDGSMTSAPPIELYHPAFAAFISRSHNPTLDVPDDVLRATAKLLRRLSAIAVSEHTRDEETRRILGEILDVTLVKLVSSDRTSADFMSAVKTSIKAITVASTIAEIKGELGTGGSDPSVQGSFSYARYICQEERDPIREISSCPSFIIGLAGPWLAILGAVMTSRTVVQRLSAYEWHGCSRVLDDAQVLDVGRRLYALRLSINDIQRYYETLAAPVVPDTHIPPRFCPSISSYTDANKKTVDFAYVKPLEPDHSCVTFLARLRDTNKDVVVKFVRRYGKDAHDWMASKKLAPLLIHHGLLGDGYGDLALVVMEHVEGQTLYQLYGDDIPEDVRQAVRTGLNALEEGGFLFGDLRSPNVMLMDANGDQTMEERVRFIDFDWACKKGDGARYPFHLSEIVRYCSGAQDYDVITKQHQDLMFDRM